MTGRRSSDADPSRDVDADRGTRRGRVAAIAFAVVVFVASIVPVPDLSTTADAGGTLPPVLGGTGPFHLVGYALLAALAARTIVVPAATGTTSSALRIGVVIAVVTSFGFGIELVQLAVPWRTFAWVDVGVNAVGATLGVAGWLLARRLVERRAAVSR